MMFGYYWNIAELSMQGYAFSLLSYWITKLKLYTVDIHCPNGKTTLSCFHSETPELDQTFLIGKLFLLPKLKYLQPGKLYPTL